MMRKKTIIILLISLILGFFFGSCATMFNGTSQVINLNSSPQGAEVTVNGRSTNKITPCHIEVPRKVKASRFNLKNEYNYVFHKDGYIDVKIQDYRKIDEILWVNCAATVFFVFTFPTDFITGAAYSYNGDIEVELRVDYLATDLIPPVISIVSPEVKRGFKHIVEDRNIIIRLKVEDENQVSFVSVNNIRLIENEYGFYQVNLGLKSGLNTVSIKAIDSKNNISNEMFTIELNDKPVYTDFFIKDDNKLINTGEYHALIIGVQDYDDPLINDLDNPVADAEKIYSVLSTKYNFKQENIQFLRNPGSNEITMALEYYFDNLSENDNLLIFYAGHGFWDKRFKQGYWLPSDAVSNNRGTWLANSTIRDYMRGISTKHSLLITDACFSGGIFKSMDAFPDASKAINKLYALPSRKAMTSGALSEVPDKSVFIEYLIKRLEQNNQKHLSSEQLFASFKIAVINNSPNSQIPQFGEVRETGDEGGDFIFIRK